MKAFTSGLPRYIVTVETAKHRVFTYLCESILQYNMLIAIVLSDGYFFGVLSSRLHIVWALASGATLEDRPRYDKTRCFDPFPFPFPFPFLDATAAAYGLSADLPEADILSRLVALNHERRREEAEGVIRRLRPEYQNPTGVRGAGPVGIRTRPSRGRRRENAVAERHALPRARLGSPRLPAGRDGGRGRASFQGRAPRRGDGPARPARRHGSSPPRRCRSSRRLTAPPISGGTGQPLSTTITVAGSRSA